MSDPTQAAGAGGRYQLRPRRRFAWRAWFRRLLVLAAVVALHQWWGQRAEQRLDRELLSLAAAGEPVSVAALATASVPGSENAVPDLRAAAESLHPSVESDALRSVFDSDPEPPLTPAEEHAILALLYRHADALARVRAARAKGGADWDIPLASPLFRTAVPDLSRQRELSWLLEFAALYAHQRHEDAAALEHLREMLFVSGAVRHHPFIWSYSTARDLTNTAARRVAEIAPELRIGVMSAGDDGAASPAQVAALIHELLDDAPSRESLRRGFQWERLDLLDVSNALADGRVLWSHLMPSATLSGGRNGFDEAVGERAVPVVDAAFPRVFRAMIYGDAVLMLRHVTHVSKVVAESPDWPTAERRGLDRPWEGSMWQAHRHMPATVLLPYYGRVLYNHYQCAAARRLAATALAVRWYACDHGGALPARLDDLVPRYLPAVPLDPLAEGGQPIRYRPDPARPILYSVGENGLDDGGAERNPLACYRTRLTSDEVRHQKRRPRPVVPPPAMLNYPFTLPATAPATSP